MDFRMQARWLLRGLKLHHRMVVVLCPEWSNPCGCVYRVSVIEFGLQQEFDPVVLLIGADRPEVRLHRLDLPLRLLICRWMEGGREPTVSTQVRTDPRPDPECKVDAVFCDHIVRDSVVADDVFNEKQGQIRLVNIIP